MAKTRFALPVFFLFFLVALRSAAQSSARDGFLTTSDGIRIHYLEAGSGPAIVFVPGWTMPGRIWEPQIKYFSRTNHVIAIDPRSQGESGHTDEGNDPQRRATDIRELIDRLHLAPAVLVGWSLGVRESLTYTEMFGTSGLRAVVLVDGEVWTKESPETNQMHADFIHSVETNRVKFTEQFVHTMYKKPQSEAYLSSLAADSLKVPTSVAVALLADLYLRNDMRPALAKIDVPLLLAVRTAHQDQAEIVRSVLPSATVEVFGDAGHALFVDDAERFNRVLETFLATTVKQKS
jgi:microsomal epoxide hydrolase